MKVHLSQQQSIGRGTNNTDKNKEGSEKIDILTYENRYFKKKTAFEKMKAVGQRFKGWSESVK